MNDEYLAQRYTIERLKVKPYATPSDIKDGFIAGYEAGYQQGYQEGHIEGYLDCENDTSENEVRE